jgi:hypothetical protein
MVKTGVAEPGTSAESMERIFPAETSQSLRISAERSDGARDVLIEIIGNPGTLAYLRRKR